MLLRISIRALVVQLESMSDIASSDLFNTVQVLQSWCFKRNSNRIYSGRKDWPGDSPTTRFAFLLVILMEIAILYAWCFFLHCRMCPIKWQQQYCASPGGPRMRAQRWGAEAVCRWCWQQQELEDGGAEPIKRSRHGNAPWHPKLAGAHQAPTKRAARWPVM